jgi:hypothetical protein
VNWRPDKGKPLVVVREGRTHASPPSESDRRTPHGRHNARRGGSFYRRRPRRRAYGAAARDDTTPATMSAFIGGWQMQRTSRIPRSHGGLVLVLPAPDRRASPLARLLAGTRKIMRPLDGCGSAPVMQWRSASLSMDCPPQRNSERKPESLFV